jgi:uncharacterized protein
MSLFLVTFFLIYGGMHCYLLLKVRGALSPTPLVLVSLVIFMLIMVCAPLIVRVSERAGVEWFAIPMAYVGYIWLGFLFLFCVSSLLCDVWRALVCLAGLASGKSLSHIGSAHRLYFLLSASLATLIACYGIVEAGSIRTERIVIKTHKLPKEQGIIRIVQISDVHLGVMVRESRLRRIIDEVKRADPHILVSTGDLLDGQTDSLSGTIALFKEVEPRFGKFAVTGNHEFYAGLGEFLSLAGKAGFRVLRGEGVSIQGVINIAGVDDIAGIPPHLYKGADEKRLLSGLAPGLFTLFLKHRPVVEEGALGLFDLQLSGHTHKGQIFPFGYMVKKLFPRLAGEFDLGHGSRLYVSRGTGTWGPPIRFLAPPEVTVIELVPAGEAP